MNFFSDTYEYDLPAEKIAQEPPEKRGTSRLLVIDRSAGTITHRTFPDLVGFLGSGDCLVVNETKVVHARLITSTSSGRELELLLVRPLEGSLWEAMARPSKRAGTGEICCLGGGGGDHVLINRELAGGRKVVDFGKLDPWEVMERYGKVPLPPYIKREPGHADRSRYQTVYASCPGAVAAPTAGLHFTEEILGEIEGKCVSLTRICLHVGPGTFRPMRGEKVEQHEMEAEFYRVGEEAAGVLNESRARGGRVIAVGTTVVRTLETLGGAPLSAGSGWTNIFIHPPHEFKNVDVLLTNFHLPRSTTLVLTAAFAGTELLEEAYREAVREGYRFYSYGDAMLVV